MAFTAGQKLSAADLGAITPGSAQAVLSGDQTVTTTAADLAGCSITITTVLSNTAVVVDGVFDMVSNGTADIFLGTLQVDGVTQTGEAHYVGTARTTVMMTWEATLATPGSHTLKLRAGKGSNSNVMTTFQNHTRIVVSGPGIG